MPPASHDVPGSTPLRVLAVFALLFLFLVGVKGLGDGFKMLGEDLLNSFFSATTNPFIALFVGILATTLVQSSSVSTSMIVALVAAPGNPLPIENAIPMIMGANIGTTVTNTLVSIGHMGRPEEFRRAFAVATCHDFFNFIAVAVLLPLELATRFMSRSAVFLVGLLGDSSGVSYKSPLKIALKTAISPIKGLCKSITDSERVQGMILGAIAAVIIYFALFLLVKVMRSVVQSRVEVFITRFFGTSAILSIVVGMLVTISVQSSSITTSLMVPMAGAGILTLRHAFPVTLGANIGTTVTALLASLAAAGENAKAGLTIAILHLLFNLIGTVLIYPIPRIREIPLRMAERLAEFAVRSPTLAIGYILFVFYGLPIVFAFVDKLLGS